MKPWTKKLLVVAFVLVSNISAFAMPEYLQLYLNDPFHSANFSGCDTCHMPIARGFSCALVLKSYVLLWARYLNI